MNDNHQDPDYVSAPPNASLMETIRSAGYTLHTAIADLIDNSIYAKAKTIRVHCEWNDGDPWVAICDDGIGMREKELEKNMHLGSQHPGVEREKGDLGRFGLGMKSASFSMARQWLKILMLRFQK